MERSQRVQWYQKPIFLKKPLLPPPFLNVIMCRGFLDWGSRGWRVFRSLIWQNEDIFLSKWTAFLTGTSDKRLRIRHVGRDFLVTLGVEPLSHVLLHQGMEPLSHLQWISCYSVDVISERYNRNISTSTECAIISNNCHRMTPKFDRVSLWQFK